MTERHPKRLTILQSAALVELIRSTYAESGLTDQEFADKASAEAGYPITLSHVFSTRRALGIDSARARKPQQADLSACVELIAGIEKELEMLRAITSEHAVALHSLKLQTSDNTKNVQGLIKLQR